MCDGNSVLQQLCRTNTTDPAQPHANLLSAARHHIQNSGVTVELYHNKGHQDSKCAGPFTQNATLNIEADQLAQDKLETYHPGPTKFHIPWSQGAKEHVIWDPMH